MKSLYSVLSLLLTSLLIIPIQGQLPSVDALGPELRVLLKSPTTATADSLARSGIAVKVVFPNGSPLAEAAVAFRLPDVGITGTFPDGSHAVVVYTDAAGNARSPVLRWSSTPGTLNLRITAAKGQLYASLLVEQTLAPIGSEAAADATKFSDNPLTPGTLPIDPPQVVIVPVPQQPALSPPALSPVAPTSKAEARSIGVIQSGASSAPVSITNTEPSVLVTTTSNARTHSHKRWLILALVGIAAGVGAAFAFKGKGSTTTAAVVSAPAIGTPTVTVGH